MINNKQLILIFVYYLTVVHLSFIYICFSDFGKTSGLGYSYQLFSNFRCVSEVGST